MYDAVILTTDHKRFALQIILITSPKHIFWPDLIHVRWNCNKRSAYNFACCTALLLFAPTIVLALLFSSYIREMRWTCSYVRDT